MKTTIYLTVIRRADGRAEVADASLEREPAQAFCVAYNRAARRRPALGRASIERQAAQIGGGR